MDHTHLKKNQIKVSRNLELMFRLIYFVSLLVKVNDWTLLILLIVVK